MRTFPTRTATATGLAAAVALAPLGAPAVGAPKIEVTDSPSAVAVISQADLAESTVTDIASVLSKVPNVASYRYGDDPGGTATLDRNAFPAASPDLIGAAVLSPGTLGYDRLTTAIEANALSFASVGAGLTMDADYALFIATREESAGVGPTAGLAAQVDFPIGFAGHPGWVASRQFPGDTWQGASLVLSGQLQLDDSFQANLIDVTNGFQPRAFDGVVAVGPDWTMAAVDMGTLTGLGTLTGYSTDPIVWGFASHVHDGSYGQCADCRSIVTAYPGVPRTVDALYPLTGEPIALATPSPEPVPGAADFPIWIVVLVLALVVLAALVVAIWWFVVRGRRPEDDCSPLLRAWNAAKRRTAAARGFLESANEHFNARMLRVAELEVLIAEYQRALDGPQAGSGGRMYAHLDGELILVDGLAELIAHVDADLADARAEADRAKEDLDARLDAFTRAEEEEQAARNAYEACVGARAVAAEAAAAAAAVGDAAQTAAAAPPAATMTRPVSTDPGEGCGCDSEASPDPVAVPVGPAQRFRLYRDFDVVSHVDESSEHGADRVGADMVTGLKDAGTTLETIGSALSGRGAALSGAKAVTGLQTGRFVKGSLHAVKGTVEGLGAIDVIPNVPTSLPEAVANGLAATANLGAFIAGKVTEWMGRNTLVTVHATYYYQWVTIQPTEVWECEDGSWVCRTLVNVYTVGGLQRERGRDQSFTVKSDPERRELRRHLATLAATGRTRITQSVQRIAEWEAANPTGDCP